MLLKKKKKFLIKKIKEFKYLTEAKTDLYVRGIENAKSIELANEIYNKALEENSKLETTEKEKEKEELEEKLKAKKIEAINLVESKELSALRKNLLINQINKAESIEEIDTILNSKILTESDNINGDKEDEDITDPSDPVEEKDFSKDTFETLSENDILKKMQEILENKVNLLDISDESKDDLKQELISINSVSDIDTFIEENNLDIVPIIKTISFNTLDDIVNKDGSKNKMLISFTRSKIYNANSLEEIKNLLEKLI
ncbi:hypothetical protein [Peptoniphilus timonensis]|uniref:hypothetical protein n=1 Tax=Peptoniphilus timonensis TaxID=1268254 RepID=UPI0002D5D824|nr:hypothetical protein [Peptoniphilus timonensis]